MIVVSLVDEKILSFLSTLGLDPTNLRGQAYDGAGNMSGSTNGTAALISSQYPLALYLHCASHSLNLAVVKSLDKTGVRNMIGIVNRVSIFFSAHPKRQRKLEAVIDRTQSGLAVKKLKDLCRTRWVERIDVLNRFKSLHSSIVSRASQLKGQVVGHQIHLQMPAHSYLPSARQTF